MKQPELAIESRLRDLSEHGQSVWIDYLSRDLLNSGELARLIDRDAVVGVTSNPTIFQKAISGGSAYDAQLQQERDQERTPKEVFYRLAARDIAAACDLLRPVWQTTSGLDGYVSWEIDPNLAADRDASSDEAHRLHGWIDRPNLYVKIPATTAGVGAIEDMIAAGRNINVTLIFSLQRYGQVVEAYISGIERLVGNGGDPAAVHSVASFFVSRVDTEADRRLEAIGGQDGLRGKLGIANAKLAYQHYLEAFSGPRWESLASKGATKQRCLWASTSTKNPAYRDVMYVEGLTGPETVNTMPEETIRAFQDHGRVAETLTQGVGEAQWLLEELERVGARAGGRGEVRRLLRGVAARRSRQARSAPRGEWLEIVSVFEILGAAGIVISALAYLPQVVHLAREHCSAGISGRAWAMWLTSSLLVGALAVHRGDMVFIMLQLSTLASATVIVFLAHK